MGNGGTTMNIRIVKRMLWPEDKRFGIHTNKCWCSKPLCNSSKSKKWVVTGYTLYVLGNVISINFGKPKNCNAPF